MKISMSYKNPLSSSSSPLLRNVLTINGVVEPLPDNFKNPVFLKNLKETINYYIDDNGVIRRKKDNKVISAPPPKKVYAYGDWIGYDFYFSEDFYLFEWTKNVNYRTSTAPIENLPPSEIDGYELLKYGYQIFNRYGEVVFYLDFMADDLAQGEHTTISIIRGGRDFEYKEGYYFVRPFYVYKQDKTGGAISTRVYFGKEAKEVRMGLTVGLTEFSYYKDVNTDNFFLVKDFYETYNNPEYYETTILAEIVTKDGYVSIPKIRRSGKLEKYYVMYMGVELILNYEDYDIDHIRFYTLDTHNDFVLRRKVTFADCGRPFDDTFLIPYFPKDLLPVNGVWVVEPYEDKKLKSLDNPPKADYIIETHNKLIFSKDNRLYVSHNYLKEMFDIEAYQEFENNVVDVDYTDKLIIATETNLFSYDINKKVIYQTPLDFMIKEIQTKNSDIYILSKNGKLYKTNLYITKPLLQNRLKYQDKITEFKLTENGLYFKTEQYPNLHLYIEEFDFLTQVYDNPPNLLRVYLPPQKDLMYNRLRITFKGIVTIKFLDDNFDLDNAHIPSANVVDSIQLESQTTKTKDIALRSNLTRYGFIDLYLAKNTIIYNLEVV